MEDHGAYRHDAAVYHATSEFLAVALPFVQDGLAAGEPVLVALPPALTERLVAELPDTRAGLTVIPHADLYRRPALGVQALQRMVAAQSPPEGGHIRVLGATPLPAARTSWQPWARFEAYLTTARAKGLAEHVVLARHAFRNALIPLVTVVGMSLPELISGAVITETIFQWPGMGMLAMRAVGARDYPLILGTIMFTATAVLLANLLVDVLYAVIDPRIRLSGKAHRG